MVATMATKAFRFFIFDFKVFRCSVGRPNVFGEHVENVLKVVFQDVSESTNRGGSLPESRTVVLGQNHHLKTGIALADGPSRRDAVHRAHFDIHDHNKVKGFQCQKVF